jgi:hypothetical protein
MANHHPDLANPHARRDGLAVEPIADEILIYDHDRDIAHCLTPVAARVWNACDGQHDHATIAALTGETATTVTDTIAQLAELHLLTTSVAAPMTRRAVITRIAITGTAAATIPLIISSTIHAPLAHASTLATTCQSCSATGPACIAGDTCDAVQQVCIGSACVFQTCVVGDDCDLPLSKGICQTGCATGGTICCP